MRLPKFILRLLLKLHKSAEATPYYHIENVYRGNHDEPFYDRYMRRDWVLGARSPDRNGDNPSWRIEGFEPPKSGRLYRLICRHLAIRAHTTYRSDSDRHLHDHPSWSLSLVLEGGYFEVCPPTAYALMHPLIYRSALESIEQGWITPMTARHHGWLRKLGIYWRGPGAIVFRSATAAHRLVLPRGTVTKSIFCLGSRCNDWGFYTPNGKVYWRTYLGLEKKDVVNQ
jgi:hypothetical protein